MHKPPPCTTPRASSAPGRLTTSTHSRAGSTTDAYRCPTIPRLLSDERMENFNFGAYAHAKEAAEHDLGYRLAGDQHERWAWRARG